MLRGPVNDVLVTGAAVNALTMTTFVYDSVAHQIRAYVNGVLNNTVAQGAVTVTGTGPFELLGYNGSASLPLGAQLDDYRVYRRAMTGADVANLYAWSSNCSGM